MIKTLITKNKTKVSNKQLEWMIDFCVRFVNKALKITDEFSYHIEVGTTKKGFKGNHRRLSGNKGLIRIWIEFEKKGGHLHVYPKFKQMPEFQTADATEDFIFVMAHELAHHKFDGNKDGEFRCELVGQDAVVAFRKVRVKYDQLVLKMRTQKRKPLTKTEKEQETRVKKFKKQIRWVRRYCKENNISYNLMRNDWSDEMSFTLNGRGRIFNGLGDYMYAVGVNDAYQRLQSLEIIKI